MKTYCLCIALIGCFTLQAQKSPYDVGTSKTQAKDTTPRSTFAARFKPVPMADWKKGMKFMTEPVKIKALGMASRIELAPYGSQNFINDQLRQSDFEWKTFIYQSREQRVVKYPTGTVTNTYLIFECEGKKYEYEFAGDTNALRKNPKAYIKKIIYLEEVDKVKEELMGKTIYILSSKWMTEDDKGKIVTSEGNQKFVAVTVTAVGLGTQDGPCKIVFKQNNSTKEGFLNVSLSGINRSTGLFGIDFDQAFAMEDPRLKYPKIKPEIWAVIQNESMRIGMSKQEAELSWGKPKEITINGDVEEWLYESGTTLKFKKDLIVQILE